MFFKKAVELIYARTLVGRQTRLQRLLFNALLVDATLQGSNSAKFETDFLKIARAIGYSSKRQSYLLNVIGSLSETTVEWGSTTTNTCCSSILATPVIFESAGRKIIYQFPDPIHNLLFFPNIYARLDLQILNLFSSKCGLSLYEWCARYRNSYRNKTCKLPWQIWQQFLTGNAVGKDSSYGYKEFKHKCLLPAIKEVTLKSDLNVDIFEYKKYRSMDSLQFLVTPKLKGSKKIGDNSGKMFNRLISFGIYDSSAKTIINNYPCEKIESCLILLFERIASPRMPPVDNRTYYLLRLLHDAS